MKFTNVKRKNILCGVLIVGYLLFFYAFMYSDILITTSHGVNLLDILFQGEIRNYYHICVSDVSNAGYEIYNVPGYDFLTYIIFAVWNFPLWVARKMGIDIWQSALTIAWAKTVVLVFTILVIRSMIKICHTLSLNKTRIEQVVMLFATSSILFSSIHVMSQYDIIYLYFMLEALNCYLQKNMKGFVFFMAIAIPIKPLSLFMYAPLVLYKEKNVIKIFIHTVIVMLPWLFFKIAIPAGVNEAYVQNMLIMFNSKFEIANIEIPTYFLAIFILYFMCYILPMPQEDKVFQVNSIRIGFIAYALFFMICGGNPYWMILLIPFWYLLIVTNEEYIFISVILETIATLSVVASFVWRVPWGFGATVVRSTYVAKMFGNRFDDSNNVLEIIHQLVPSLYDLAIDRVQGYLFGIFLATILAFIYLSCCKGKEFALKGIELPKYMYFIRIGVCVVICMLPMISYIF